MYAIIQNLEVKIYVV